MIEIRPLSDQDAEPWQRLWRGYQAFYKAEIPEATSRVTWRRILAPAEPIQGALAWEGPVAVGLVHWILHRSTWTVGDYCYLQDLFVDPARRGGGTGRRLIEHVYADATRRGCSRVHWLTHETNHEAMQLYDRIGDRSGFVQYRKMMPASGAG